MQKTHMIHNKIGVIAYIVLLFQMNSTNSFCQDNNDTVSYKRLSKFALASIDYTHYSSSEYVKDDEAGKIHMNEYKAKIQFALKLKEKKTYLLNKMYVTRFDANAAKGEFQNFNENYFSFSYSIGLIQIINNRWKIVGLVSPTLASDFNNGVSSHDFILQSSAIASKRAGANFEYGFGIGYSTRFGRALAVPLISYTYVQGNWCHKGVAPAYMTSYYTIKQFDIGIKLSAFGNVYNSTNEILSDQGLDKLGYSRINIGPDFNFCIYKSLYANINTGITVRNRLFSIDSRGKLEMELSAGTKSFFNVGLRILK